ncbi:shTK domain protein [Ancylostoma caninum]|uniref:Metalloendopeptidase n=1 Tax=Ancylostoma caninum TaxID=29170 RepID=A0A368FJY6_ANCCA|nr:shTK domain protein [Ancylostoma caninum]
MRLLLLVLLLALCANAGFFDTKLGEKIKQTLGKIKAAFNSTALIAIREKFNSLKEKIKAKLTLSPEQKVILEELLKHIRKIKKDKVQEKGDSIEEINGKKHVAELLYQGDIVLTRKQADEIVEDIENESGRTKRQAYRDHKYPRTLWENNRVNYYFHHNATSAVKSVFRKGAGLWQKDTCIDFVEDSSARDRIRVFVEDGCWSYIGRLGKEQDLSLGDGCETVGIAAHEIGHAIGFWHTHARHDRDKFITFNAHNVKPSWLDQFAITTPATNDNYGITYDYGNIMHYGATRSHQEFSFLSGGNVSTPKPQPQQKCVDNAKCALLTKTRKFCSSVVFTESIKRSLCPKTCGYCR